VQVLKISLSRRNDGRHMAISQPCRKSGGSLSGKTKFIVKGRNCIRQGQKVNLKNRERYFFGPRQGQKVNLSALPPRAERTLILYNIPEVSPPRRIFPLPGVPSRVLQTPKSLKIATTFFRPLPGPEGPSIR
jgi:hypothetical protein